MSPTSTCGPPTASTTRAPEVVRRGLAIAALIVAGEAVFGLPFHVARFFRPTLLAGLGITNSELGGLFAVYGALAMLSYVPGGLLADRFSARRMMTLSMALTGGLGLYLATLPDLRAFVVVHACFGVTTILLFWAAMIRATRAWGGAAEQGRAFGLLEGGRGLFAAGLASLALIPFSAAFVGDVATQAERLTALHRVYLVYTAATFAAAALVWLCVPDDVATRSSRPSWRDVGRAVASPVVWLQALVVLTAYCAYKGVDNYALFAMQVGGLDELAGTQVSVLSAWLRPIAALAAGLLADRIRPTRAAQLCFAALIVGYAVLFTAQPGASAALWLGVAVTCAAAFGLRGVYFAVMEEVRVPVAVTGTAVGLISVIGFAPDVFLAPLTGWLLDRSPGLAGHHHVFLVLAALACAGLVASVVLRRFSGRTAVSGPRPGR